MLANIMQVSTCPNIRDKFSKGNLGLVNQGKLELGILNLLTEELF